jgi:hypothetical protein
MPAVVSPGDEMHACVFLTNFTNHPLFVNYYIQNITKSWSFARVLEYDPSLPPGFTPMFGPFSGIVGGKNWADFGFTGRVVEWIVERNPLINPPAPPKTPPLANFGTLNVTHAYAQDVLTGEWVPCTGGDPSKSVAPIHVNQRNMFTSVVNPMGTSEFLPTGPLLSSVVSTGPTTMNFVWDPLGAFFSDQENQ